MLKERFFIKSDSAWVITIQDGILKHPTPEIHRTKRFFRTLGGYVQMHYERVYGATMCVQCHQFLCIKWPKIEKEFNENNVKILKNIGARYEECTSKTKHKRKRPRLDFNHALSEKSKKFIKLIREKREMGRKKAKAKGKNFGQKRLDRSRRRQGLPLIK